MRGVVWLCLVIIVLVGLAACQETGGESSDFTITVDVDGDRLVYHYPRRISVGQFLDEIGVIRGEDDEVNPIEQTQIRDGMRITITRFVTRRECEEVETPYGRETRYTQQLPPGETSLGQAGSNGIDQICYRVTFKDGVETERVQINRIVKVEPQNEIIFVGSKPLETLLAIEGTLVFISGGQAYIIRGNTANLSPLTQDVFLDGQVFDLSPDGKQLLYTIEAVDEDEQEPSNELLAILDTTANRPQPVQLVWDTVRMAQWVPGDRTLAVSYSTASATEDGSWQAYNDVHLMQLDPETGEVLGVPEEIVMPNGLGAYAYWGRRFVWSPDGTQLAWANADSLGLVDLDTGDFVTLLTFAEYAPFLERPNPVVWVPTLSWSADGHLVTTLHGEPYNDEGDKHSIVFDVAVLDTNSDLQIKEFIPRSGIWSNPVYSPVVTGPDGEPTYYIAFFQAREPLNSPSTEYDLVVVDRDGSNPRVIFPGPDRPGLRLPDPEDSIAWSPQARQIALIHQGNLWIVDIDTELAYPITSDGQASHPRWSRQR